MATHGRDNISDGDGQSEEDVPIPKRRKLDLEVLSSTVDESDLLCVVKTLDQNELHYLYSTLGILHRDVKKEEAKADTTDVNLKGQAVLRFWKQQLGSEATWNTLLGAYEKCQFINAKETLEMSLEHKLSDRRSQITAGSSSAHHDQQDSLRIEPIPARHYAPIPQQPHTHSMQPSGTSGQQSAMQYPFLDPGSPVPSSSFSIHQDQQSTQIQRDQRNHPQTSAPSISQSNLPLVQPLGQQSMDHVLHPGSPVPSSSFSIHQDQQSTQIQRDQRNHPQTSAPSISQSNLPLVQPLGQQSMDHVLRQSCKEFDLEVCKQELVMFYKSEMSKVQLLPWCDETRDMDDIYVTLELKEGRKRGKVLERNEDLVSLQTSQHIPATRILLKGVAGSGKSTLLVKLAYSWAQQSLGSPLYRFKLLFILSLREIEVGCSLIDALFQQVFERTTRVSKERLKNYIELHPEDIILLLDAFDEYSATELSASDGSLDEILASRALRQCRTILSTRPHKDLLKYQSNYLVVNVLGFSKRNTELYISKFFRGHAGMVEGLKQKLSESNMLTALSGIPVMLMLMCLLWEDDQKLPETQSKLYQEFVLFLWRKYWDRKGKQIICDDESDESEIKEHVLNLGKVAFSGICPNENIKKEQLVFSESDFDITIFQLGCETGLLTRERLRSKLKRYSSVTFLHKSFQEFCAAKYWASLCDTKSNGFHIILMQLSIWQLFLSKFEMVKFCCGLVDLKTVVSILQHAVSLYNKTNYFDAKIRVGYNKPESNKKHITPILALLYESQLFFSELNEAPEACANCPLYEKSNSKTGSTLESSLSDSETITSHQSSDSHELISSLIQSFKSLFPDEGLELDISNNNKLSTSIFNNFVKSDFASKVLSTIRSVSVINLPSKSLSVMKDMFNKLLRVQKIKFLEQSDDGVLCQLLPSLNADICVDIVYKGGKIKMDTILWLVSKLKHLKSMKLDNVDLIVGKSHAEAAIQNNQIIKELVLQYTNTEEAKGPGSNTADINSQTLKEASIVLYGYTDSYGNELLCHLMSSLNNRDIGLDIVFIEGKILIDTTVWLASNLEHLKSMQLNNVDLIPGKSHDEAAIQNNQIIKVRVDIVYNGGKIKMDTILCLVSRLKHLKSMKLDNVDLIVGKSHKIIKVCVLQYTNTEEAKGPGSNTADINSQTLKEASIVLDGYTDSYGNDLLCQLMSSLKDIGLDIVFNKGKITIDTMMWLVSNVENLKSLKFDFVHLIIGKSHVVDAIQNKPIESPSLQHVNKEDTQLCRSTMGSQEQMHSEAAISPSNASDLQVLELINCDAPKAIGPRAKQLQHCTKLHTLNLRNCKINEDHIKVLIGSLLSKALNLQELNLSNNTVGMAMSQLNQCTKLVKLDLSLAHLTNQGVIELAHRFPFMPNLTYLDIRTNYINNTGFDAVFKHIHYLTKLERLSINGYVDNHCSDLVKKCLAAVEESIPVQGGKEVYISNTNKNIQAIRNAARAFLSIERSPCLDAGDKDKGPSNQN